MTARVGLRPLDEEYILMGMAAYGKPVYDASMQQLFINFKEIVLKDNLHIGVDEKFLPDADEMDIAASAQAVVEQLIETVIKKAKKLGKSDNLVYGGGVALN
jgi:carbamoyltransferase